MTRRTVVDPRFARRLRELCEARGLSLRALAGHVYYSKSRLHQVETGSKRPTTDIASRLDKALDAGGELTAMVTEVPEDPHDTAADPGRVDVDLRLMTRLAGTAWFGALPREVAGLVGTSPLLAMLPTRLEQPHVAALWSSIDMFEQWDHQYGGGLVRAAMAGQFVWACHAAREASMRGDVRQAWLSAAARLGDLVGWASFDAGEDGAARRYFLTALNLASEAEDLEQRCHTATSMSRQLTYLGRTGDALDVTDLARLAWRRLPPLGRAVIEIVEARAYGRIGDRQACRRAVGICDDHFAASPPDASEDPVWKYYADEGQVLGDAGHALFDLAITTGDQRQSATTIERLEAAYATHPRQARRSRALTMIRVACLKARYGDPEGACAAAEDGVADAVQVWSRRVADDLQTLDASLRCIKTRQITERVGRVRADIHMLSGGGG